MLTSASCLSLSCCVRVVGPLLSSQQLQETDKQGRHCYNVSHLTDKRAKTQRLWLAQGPIIATGARYCPSRSHCGLPSRISCALASPVAIHLMPLKPTSCLPLLLSLPLCLCYRVTAGPLWYLPQSSWEVALRNWLPLPVGQPEGEKHPCECLMNKQLPGWMKPPHLTYTHLNQVSEWAFHHGTRIK